MSDAVAHGLDEKVPECVTDRVPLVGAEGFAAAWNRRSLTAAASGLHVARIEHLLGRYGTLTDELLELIAADPSLGEPLEGAEDYLRVEVVYACSHEGARHLDDVLARRTRISIETWDRGVRAAPAAAKLMAGALGWDAAQITKEIDAYRARVDAEVRSQREPDDEAADAVRLAAPEIVPLER